MRCLVNADLYFQATSRSELSMFAIWGEYDAILSYTLLRCGEGESQANGRDLEMELVKTLGSLYKSTKLSQLFSIPETSSTQSDSLPHH